MPGSFDLNVMFHVRADFLTIISKSEKLIYSAFTNTSGSQRRMQQYWSRLHWYVQ